MAETNELIDDLDTAKGLLDALRVVVERIEANPPGSLSPTILMYLRQNLEHATADIATIRRHAPKGRRAKAAR